MILVTGGARYVGSHYVQYALEQGEEVIVLDNLVYGHREAVPADVELVVGTTADRDLLRSIFSAHPIDAVVHFAAYAYVGESVTEPSKYYDNNTVAALALLDGMHEAGVTRFVFSSTCATYGEPRYVPIDEAHPQDPINPYGETKYFDERILKAYDRAYGFRFVALRYFNAAGADPEGRIGESHDPETHLIPLVLQTAQGKRESVRIFGTDYDTPDGTCVRDYIHVLDLAQAHSLALDRLRAGGSSEFYNLGTERGNSVQEVVSVCEQVSGRKIATEVTERRAGDPPRLVASSRKAREHLGWQVRYPELRETVETAWRWEQYRRY